jgi:hypothetical protein
MSLGACPAGLPDALGDDVDIVLEERLLGLQR